MGFVIGMDLQFTQKYCSGGVLIFILFITLLVSNDPSEEPQKIRANFYRSMCLLALLYVTLALVRYVKLHYLRRNAI